MVRSIAVAVIFMVGVAALLSAQAQKEQAVKGQEARQSATAQPKPGASKTESSAQPVKEQGNAEEKDARSANSEYPLDAFKNFSAVMIGSVTGGDEESHIYRLDRLMRTDVGGSYAVTDMIKGDTYGVSRTGCLHDPRPAFHVYPFRAARSGFKVERVPVGKETVDGHVCKIEEVTVRAEPPVGSPLKMRFWEAEDLQGFPVKIETIRPGGHNVIIRYKDVVLAPPDPALFNHPAKCQVLAPGELPGKGGLVPPAKKPSATAPASSPQK